MEDSKTSARNIEAGVKKYAERLMEIAEAARRLEHLTEYDKSILRHGHSDIASYLEPMLELINKLREFGYGEATTFAHECLWRLLQGAFLIGSRAVIPEGAEDYFRAPVASEGQRAQAAAARDKFVKNSGAR